MLYSVIIPYRVFIQWKLLLLFVIILWTSLLLLLLLLSFSSTSMLTILVFVLALYMKTSNIICWLRKQPHQYVWALQETPNSMCASPIFFLLEISQQYMRHAQKNVLYWLHSKSYCSICAGKLSVESPPPPPPRIKLKKGQTFQNLLWTLHEIFKQCLCFT